MIDKYDSYQILDDIWNIIAGYLEIINSEGIEACNKVDPIIEIKKKGDVETEVQVGIKGRIIPFDLVIDFKLQTLKDELNLKNNKLAEIESRISEIFDSLSEDEKIEIEDVLTEENDNFVPKEVTKKVKDYLKSNISEGTVEIKVVEVNNLYEEQKKLNKSIKDTKTILETEAKKAVENLTYGEICELLTKKWINPIVIGIDKQIDNLILEFSKNIEKLSHKYNKTLFDIDNEIKEAEKVLVNMISELTGSDYDMKGLEDLKSLFDGD